jgi:hypothetical protein
LPLVIFVIVLIFASLFWADFGEDLKRSRS